MTVSFKGELAFFAASLLFGCLCGILYDLFRFLRLLFLPQGEQKPSPMTPRRLAFLRYAKATLLFLLDFLYAVLAGIFYIVFVYASHSGVFRLYSLFALFFGMLLYFKSVGRAVRLLLRLLAKALRRLVLVMLWPLARLFAVFSRIFSPFLRKTRCFLKDVVVKYKVKRSNVKQKRKKKENSPRKQLSERTFVFGKTIK